MANSPVAGIYYPPAGNTVDVPGDMKKMTDTLDPVVVAIFPTVSARNSGVTAPVQGQVTNCLDSGLWERVGSTWLPVGPRIATTKAYTGTPPVSSTAAGPANVPNIHDATFTSTRRRLYRSTLTGILQGDTVNAQYRLYVTDESGTRLDIRDEITAADNLGRKYFSYPAAEYVLPAGTHAIGCTFTLIIGGGTMSLLGMTLTIVDLGPA